MNCAVEAGWTAVTETANIPQCEGRAVTLEGREIAIFHVDQHYFAIDNKCPHKGGPLCDGIVSGTTVVCPLHGRRFDLQTGMPVRSSEQTCIEIFPARAENGIIFVKLSGPS